MLLEDRRHFLICLALGAALVALTMFCFLIGNEFDNLYVIGWLLVGKSALTAFLFRKEKKVSILLMVQVIVDVNVAFSVCFHPEIYLSVWQERFYLLPENVITAKALLLFSASLTCGLYFAGPVQDHSNEIPKIESSTLIDIVLIVFMLYALIFGLDRGTVGAYSSNTNPSYEYAIVAFIMLWYGSGGRRGIRFFLIAYAVVYILQGLLFGDRSSAFPMIIALYLLQSRIKPKLPVLLLVGLGGIVFANCIDIFRNTGVVDEQFFARLVDAGFYSNTVSYSFYAGTAITLFGEYVGNTASYFVDLVLATFLGNSTVNVNLANVAKAAGTTFFNRGGGFSSSFFNFYFGYIGVVVAGLVIGVVVRKLSDGDTLLCNLLTTTLMCFFIRWYVYYPLVLTRSALLVPVVIYVAYRILSKSTRGAGGQTNGDGKVIVANNVPH